MARVPFEKDRRVGYDLARHTGAHGRTGERASPPSGKCRKRGRRSRQPADDAQTVRRQALEAAGTKRTRMSAALFGVIARRSPEGFDFKCRTEDVGWKRAVRELSPGTFDRPVERAGKHEKPWRTRGRERTVSRDDSR